MQDREPDEFRESTSLFANLVAFPTKIVWHYLVSTYFYPDFGRSFSEANHAL